MKINNLERWQTEIQLSEEFREKEFGQYSRDIINKAGENIDYFDKGYTFGHFNDNVDDYTTLNLFHSITKNIVPALYYQNPKINAIPLRKTDQTAAPLAREIVNHYFRETEAQNVNKKVIWDAYVLGYGVYKTGYATKYGVDVIDKKEIGKRRQKSLLERVGLAKPKEEEKLIHPEENYTIIEESPYIQYVSPFNFLIDPRASCLEEAKWVAHVVRKTVESLKKNPKYKNTKDLEGMYEPNLPSNSNVKIPDSAIEAFRTVDLYEIHYRTDKGMYILVMTKDKGGIFKEHYHELSPYEIDGFQFDMLTYNKHGHALYPRSDLTKVKNLQDRFTSTFDNILEQIDRFVPKIGADVGKMSDDAKRNLENGDVGAVVYTSGNPRDIVSEISFTQLKADLLATIDRIVDVVTIQTGITKAKLLGVSTAETATGEQLSKGGETLRLAEMSQFTEEFVNKQAVKMWQIIRQFAPFEELNLITGEQGIDPETGETLYTWLPDIDGEMSEKLSLGQYRFEMTVGSTQRHDISTIRKQFENLINIVSNSNAVAIAQQQGKKIDVGEFLKMYLSQFPEVIRDVNRIVQDITQMTPNLVDDQAILGGPGGQTDGSGTNALRALQGQQPASSGQVAAGGAQI